MTDIHRFTAFLCICCCIKMAGFNMASIICKSCKLMLWSFYHLLSAVTVLRTNGPYFYTNCFLSANGNIFTVHCMNRFKTAILLSTKDSRFKTSEYYRRSFFAEKSFSGMGISILRKNHEFSTPNLTVPSYFSTE